MLDGESDEGIINIEDDKYSNLELPEPAPSEKEENV